MKQTRRRPTSPAPVRQVARAAGLSLRKLAEAILDGQPPPVRPRDQAVLLRWLGQSVRSEHPDAALDEQAGSWPTGCRRWRTPVTRRRRRCSRPRSTRSSYRWLFGDEAVYVASMELRVEAGPRFVEDHGLRAVLVPHPGTGEPALVTRDEVAWYAEDDQRVLDAALRYPDPRP